MFAVFVSTQYLVVKYGTNIKSNLKTLFEIYVKVLITERGKLFNSLQAAVGKDDFNSERGIEKSNCYTNSRVLEVD